MPLVAYIILIILLHLIPLGGQALNKTTFGPFRLDYLLHTGLFLPWMLLVSMRINRTPNGRRRLEICRLAIGPFFPWTALGLALAAGAETMQLWVPSRSFNPIDAVFSGLGVVIGAGVVAMVGQWLRTIVQGGAPFVVPVVH